MKIIVPATSANLGAGFDSIGIALNLYLTVEVLERQDFWQIDHNLGSEIATDENNLLLTTLFDVLSAKKTVLSAKYHLKMTSAIPLARGLGSSSSVIVAGIELANQLADLKLSPTEKLDLACQIEGHPDNVAPAIFGNLVVASTVDTVTNTIKAAFPNCKFLAFVPHHELKTVESRKVLPEVLPYKEAVAASAIANVLTASLLTGDLETAGQVLETDRFHEIYRAALIPELAILREIGHQFGAYGTYLSGAGPTVMLLCSDEKRPLLLEKIKATQLKGEIYALEIDTKGLRVEKNLP
ncbi:homoserine kinase [Lactococcus kimchii]|uniref:homoserine kinase n=1 Tax=Lactococcus sp. S-13 TaxID=2507158 RepID=UPI0010234E92|nr:homoserine kinase [Lactococcus sp. S-13]RZI48183.1 homoserine kinase [Lactococcus sp. S-13]